MLLKLALALAAEVRVNKKHLLASLANTSSLPAVPLPTRKLANTMYVIVSMNVAPSLCGNLKAWLARKTGGLSGLRWAPVGTKEKE